MKTVGATSCGIAFISIDTALAVLALTVSALALGASIHFWRRQFRPIVTAAVKTASGGGELIAYNLTILNSGTIPAKNITLEVDESSLSGALGVDSTADNRARWLACFSPLCCIKILHNGARVSCSFGTTRAGGQGFWRAGGQVSITIAYEGWFGKKYTEKQTIEIMDSASFTGYMWGDDDT